MTAAHGPVIDGLLILRAGDEILLSQRGSPYGYGPWHAPSGKLDPGEPLTVATAREAYEETGVVIDPEPRFTGGRNDPGIASRCFPEVREE